MKRNYLFKLLLLFIICFSFTTSLYGCKSKDKEIVVAENVKEDLKSTNAEILQLIEEGNSLLQSQKFSEARSTYEKAISKNKSNNNTYLQIKDTYMKAKRFDDAYYIIKLAIYNDVSKDEMSKTLEEIKNNFSSIELKETILKDSTYSLPTQITIPINSIDTPVNIAWSQKDISTSNVGTFTFTGYVDEYGKTIQLTLTIREVVKSTIIGYITDIYNENGNTYINLDQIEFYRNKDAQREYAKDGFTPSPVAFGNDYYIRNNNKELKTYMLSKTCSFKTCTTTWDESINSYRKDSLAPISKDNFITSFNENLITKTPYWITTEDDIVTIINMQYIP